MTTSRVIAEIADWKHIEKAPQRFIEKACGNDLYGVFDTHATSFLDQWKVRNIPQQAAIDFAWDFNHNREYPPYTPCIAEEVN